MLSRCLRSAKRVVRVDGGQRTSRSLGAPKASLAVRAGGWIVKSARHHWRPGGIVRVGHTRIPIQAVINVSRMHVTRVSLLHEVTVLIVIVLSAPLVMICNRIGDEGKVRVELLLWVCRANQSRQRIVHEETLLLPLFDLLQVSQRVIRIAGWLHWRIS